MKEPKKKLLQWHPAFFAGLQIELAEDADNLIFENEHHLGTKPKQIDVLVIKKDSQKPVRKNIGQIFRKYNIVEYKAPDDYLSIDDFYQVYGYTCFYKADSEHVNEIKIEELTISLVCYKFPRELMRHIKEQGYELQHVEPGIIYIKGLVIPMQLILVPRLSEEENLWLKSLTNDLREPETAKKILEEYGKHKADRYYKSVMNLITNANHELFKEVNHMCEALMEIMREEWKTEFEEVENRAMERVNKLIQTLIATSRSEEIERAVTDKDYQQKLFEEFGL